MKYLVCACANLLFLLLSSSALANPAPKAIQLDDFFSGKVNAVLFKKMCEEMANEMSMDSICQQCSGELCSVSYKELKKSADDYLDSMYGYDEGEEKIENPVKKQELHCGDSNGMDSMLLTIGSGDSCALVLASDTQGVYIKHYQVLSDRIYSYSPIGRQQNLIYMYTNSGNAGLDYQTDYFVFNELCEMNSTFSFSCSEYVFDEHGKEYRPNVPMGRFYINKEEVAEYPCLPVMSSDASHKGGEELEDAEELEEGENVESKVRLARSFESVLSSLKKYPVLSMLLQNIKSEKEILDMLPSSIASEVRQMQFYSVNYPPFPSDYLIDCSRGSLNSLYEKYDIDNDYTFNEEDAFFMGLMLLDDVPEIQKCKSTKMSRRENAFLFFYDATHQGAQPIMEARRVESPSPQSDKELSDYLDSDYFNEMKNVEKMAERGYGNAEFYLGRLLYYRYSVKLGSKKRGMEFITRAAEHGISAAQYMVGMFYELGIGRPVDKIQAMQWFDKAYQNGSVEAAFILYIKYMDGIDLPNDPVQAKQILDRYAHWHPWLALAQSEVESGQYCNFNYHYVVISPNEQSLQEDGYPLCCSPDSLPPFNKMSEDKCEEAKCQEAHSLDFGIDYSIAKEWLKKVAKNSEHKTAIQLIEQITHNKGGH